MIPLITHLSKEIELGDDLQTKKIRVKAESCVFEGGVMYRRGARLLWLRCITSEEGKRVIEELR